jgi:dUTP pyrophosphatase
VKLKIKILDESVRAHYENYKAHHDGDSGIDIMMPKDAEIFVHSFFSDVIGLGIACEADKSFLIIPRSSMPKTGLMLANSIGLIDKGYRGELKACFFKPRSYCCAHIRKGDRLLQIIDPTLEPITIEIVDELSETSRGENGIGSTGA